MKVFMCKRSGGYSGGLAVVAANTREEAFLVLHSHGDFAHLIDNLDMETGCFTRDIAKCNSYDYKREDWFEVPILSADTIVPRVIEEAGYSE